MSTIDERIAKHKIAAEKAGTMMEKYNALLLKHDKKYRFHSNAAFRLSLKKEKADAKAKKLVESGVLTNEQLKEIEKLPVPEQKEMVN